MKIVIFLLLALATCQLEAQEEEEELEKMVSEIDAVEAADQEFDNDEGIDVVAALRRRRR